VTAAGERSGGSLAEAAYQDIRRRVLRCELAPGERVTEAGLVVLTGHSRTPVREALGRLAREGLVRPIPRQGYRVTPVTLGDVEDLFDMWSILGPAVAERAAGRLTAAGRGRMRSAVETDGYDADDAASVDAWLAAMHDAQVAMAEATGNVRLVEAVDRLDADFQRVFRVAFLAHDLGPPGPWRVRRAARRARRRRRRPGPGHRGPGHRLGPRRHPHDAAQLTQRAGCPDHPGLTAPPPRPGHGS
jgi:DNA-binding GntR family transcriptional regulator